jgi:enoyl-CoA hydratase
MAKWLHTTETIKFEVRDRVAYITLNRPEKRNALSDQLLNELNRALMEADDLREVRCVVLAGEGKDFCAGYDLGGNYQAKVLAEAEAKARGEKPPEDPYRPQGAAPFDDDTWMLERMQDLKMIIFDMHKPVIARVHGNCLAGGTDIAFLCDMVIATNDARLGFPATRSLGSPPQHMWLYHCGPQWSKRLLMTGDCVRGKDAAKIGLVMKAVPADKLDHEVNDLTRRLSSVEADLLAAQKRIVNLGLEMMGARTLQRLAGEADARAHLSKARYAWRDDVAALGLKGALRKRDEPFGDGDARVDELQPELPRAAE